ncbi:hypothetical protein FJT64_025861 [Amphibalanus amphitrite]|uniref:Uncharacterized protein n=1 Tax=Amphibalanus amphitrite TaxID=1232801 RepID=A0A6A4W3X6_AMPAM|nr:hypothetical protein FJT64_025861 [Amphibalanus amphitrite]
MTAVAEKVSQQVASHIRLIPRLKGKSVIPSGRRPSPLSRPVGSKTLEPCTAECPPQHVIEVSVTRVAASTLGTGETVVAQSVNGAMAELTVMRFTYRRPESQRHCYPHCFIIQMESHTGDGECLHPSGSVGLCSSQKTRPGHLVCPVQQTLLRHLTERLIPSTLFALF